MNLNNQNRVKSLYSQRKEIPPQVHVKILPGAQEESKLDQLEIIYFSGPTFLYEIFFDDEETVDAIYDEMIANSLAEASFYAEWKDDTEWVDGYPGPAVGYWEWYLIKSDSSNFNIIEAETLPASTNLESYLSNQKMPDKLSEDMNKKSEEEQ